MSEHETAIPKGSRVLITGCNGFLASHVAKQFLKRGFKVRGTVRDVVKSSFLVNNVFKDQAIGGTFEIVEILDLTAQEPVAAAMKDVAAVVHIAAILSFDPDPNNVVTPTVSSMNNLLQAAKQVGVTRFVYCTTGGASTDLTNKPKVSIDRNSWNDEAVAKAWAPPPYGPDRGLDVYVASKIEAEKAMWKFNAEQQRAGSSFVANSVSSAMILGEVLHNDQPASSAGWVRNVYNGGPPVLMIPVVPFVNVKDDALVHVAAVLDPGVKNSRLQAWSKVINWNNILGCLRKLYPEQRKIVDDVPDSPMFEFITDDREVTLGLLQKWGGQSEFRGLEESIRDTIKGLRE